MFTLRAITEACTAVISETVRFTDQSNPSDVSLNMFLYDIMNDVTKNI